jgi:prephenate dehydratase
MATYDAAFQGSRGAFTELASWQLLTNAATLLPCTRFEDVFRAVTDGTARYGVIPVENTLAGSVHLNFDLLNDNHLVIVGETVCRIEHALVGAPGVKLEQVRRVLSHPVALAQCERFFREHPEIQAVPEFDTAGAVEKVIREKLTDAAAIAGRRNAEIYGGTVLADNIQDHSENYTRFLLISREDTAPPAPSKRSKTTIAFKLGNVPGALFHSLEPFAKRGIDLTKIESRPLKGSPFEYLFYVDLVAEPGQREALAEAVRELRVLSKSVRVLGTYSASGVVM